MKQIDPYSVFTSFWRQQDRLQPQDRILVAISGGVDSVVLLHLMKRLAQEWPIHICAGHVNHQLRGEEADEDERFVRRLCRQWGVKLHVRRVDVAQYRREHRLGTEEAARVVRYEALATWARRHHCRYIALGHTADDQVETVLLQFLRGAGIAGLCGMPAERGNIIRPLLTCRRAQIEAYARQHHLQWRHDRSNDDVSFTRNHIRHMLLPLLRRKFNPQIDANLQRLATIMRQAHDYLQTQAEAALHSCLIKQETEKIILEIDHYLSYYIILQKYMLRLCLRRLQGDERLVDSEGWETFSQFIHAARPSSPLRWRGPWEIWRWQNQIVILKHQAKRQPIAIERVPCTIKTDNGYRLEIKKSSAALNHIESNADPYLAWIDADRVRLPLTLRHWHSGDRFWPLGAKAEKSVAAFLKDARVPNYQRGDVYVLTTSDEVIWLCGHRLDDRFKVTQQSNTIYRLKLRKNVDP